MKKRSFYYFLFIVSAQALCMQLLGLYLPLYFREIGLSGLHTGAYFSVSSIATLVLSLPMGVSTDRRSIRMILAVCFSLVSISYLGFVISKSFAVFCAFALLASFGRRFANTATNAMFFKVGGDSLRNAGLFMLMRLAAMGTGTMIGALLIDSVGYRSVFLATIGGYALLAALSTLLPANERVVIKVEEYRHSVFTPQVLFLAAVFSLSSLHWGAETVAYAPFLKVNLGLSMKQVGVFVSLGLASVGVASCIGVVCIKKGWVSDMRHLLMFGLALSGAFHILMCIPQNVYWVFTFRILHEAGDGLVMLVFYHGISKVFHVDRIGGCSAFMSLCMGLSAMASSVVFGHIGDVMGYQWPLIISGIVLLCIPVLLKIGARGFIGDGDA